jgi:hypothetical protein
LLPERPIVTEEMAPADLWVTIASTGAGRKGLPTDAYAGECGWPIVIRVGETCCHEGGQTADCAYRPKVNTWIGPT